MICNTIAEECLNIELRIAAKRLEQAEDELERVNAELDAAVEWIMVLSGYQPTLSAALAHIQQQDIEQRSIRRQLGALRDEMRATRMS